MTESAARTALAAWGLEKAQIQLIARRENIVYRVNHQGATYALRLHRPGYQTEAMIRSELAWMQYLGAAGLTVPAPVPSRSAALLEKAAGFSADLLTWLDGQPLGATGTPLALADREGTFAAMGAMMARVHRASDIWDRPSGFIRKSWDIEGLLGDTPLWDRFWDNPALTPQQRTRTISARDALQSDLAARASDFGLIHADMLRENVMINGTILGLIDFDDSGFGYRLFDVATALIKNRMEPDYPALKSAFLNGYRAQRPLDTTLLPQFMLIRALSYMGWIITRMDEPGARVRQHRFLTTAMPMVDSYLAGRLDEI